MNLVKYFLFAVTIMFANLTFFQAVAQGWYSKDGNKEILPPGVQVSEVRNDIVACRVSMADGKLLSADFMEMSDDKEFVRSFTTSADFRLDFYWAGWKAPGKTNNADTKVRFSKKDFEVIFIEKLNHKNCEEIIVDLEGINNPFEVRLIYRLDYGDFFVKKKVMVRDTLRRVHFLDKIWPVKSLIAGATGVIKEGGFGQPVALLTREGGAFFGVEYPASENLFESTYDGMAVKINQLIGKVVKEDWVSTDWAVCGITPDERVKFWFMKYVDEIRIAPLKPYTLYNSWYDLRSTEYPGVDSLNHMNEDNIMRIIDLLTESMIMKHDIKLDAFVLDDGWDIYESDWKLRDREFPRGLKPIAERLSETNTDLGIWYGPAGGYSFRMKRIDWMRENGYETVGEEKEWHSEMLCMGGEKYSSLFNKRVTVMVMNDDVRYFKWDGIQFGCNEPDHGHPVGIYSTRSILDSVISKCDAVRALDPEVYLNITSGTWLSPWWVKYANQIWMDAGDYGLSDIPSWSKRDAAITYRDLSLYNDFHTKDLWFPLSNLMTHGIIKGQLQKLGGEQEPIDKFTDNALLYFARGVSMWELYISPDILTEEEWKAISESIHWAEDRFDILKHTEMIGGDPANNEPYGYVHFQGEKGIIALRNPSFYPQEIEFNLSDEYGLFRKAASLVMEQVYPVKWISPNLYSEGATITVSLDSYETVIYEIYPVEEALKPLLSGVVFGEGKTYDNHKEILIYAGMSDIRLLNPEKIKEVQINREVVAPGELILVPPPAPVVVDSFDFSVQSGRKVNKLSVALKTGRGFREGMIGLLFDHSGIIPPDEETSLKVMLGDSIVKHRQRTEEGKWTWVMIPLAEGRQEFVIEFPNDEYWNGKSDIWFSASRTLPPIVLDFRMKDEIEEKPMPPLPLPQGVFRVNRKLGTFTFKE